MLVLLARYSAPRYNSYSYSYSYYYYSYLYLYSAFYCYPYSHRCPPQHCGQRTMARLAEAQPSPSEALQSAQRLLPGSVSTWATARDWVGVRVRVLNWGLGWG